jgi:hypothetical protein
MKPEEMRKRFADDPDFGPWVRRATDEQLREVDREADPELAWKVGIVILFALGAFAVVGILMMVVEVLT